jgi:uncharacterized Tic20 family protein
MPVAVICPTCRAKLKAPDGLIGKTVKCPGCATPVLVKEIGAAAAIAPAPSRMATTPRPAPKKPRPPEPEILDEEPEEEMLDEVEDEVEDEEVEARPRKKKGKGEKRSAKSGDTSDSERSTASFIHFATLINLIFAPFGYLVPLLLWVMKRKESAFVDHHGKTWLNFQLSMFVVSLGLIMLGVGLGIGLSFIKPWLGLIGGVLVFITAAALGIYMLVMHIVAGMKAKKGEWFEYRCLFRLFK